MKAAAPAIALVLAALLVPASDAAAQRDDGRHRQGQGPAMSSDQRQRMREDMREVYRERSSERGARPERPRSLSPQEREKLREDVRNANKALKR